jgi:serine phosphatase RsbU (regulator of sigma subunit)
LLDGEVEALKAQGTADERLLGVRGPGAMLGEMSLFSDASLRTASVRAKTDVRLMKLSKQDLDELLRRQPEYAYEMMRMLSERLDESENLTIKDLRAKNIELTRAYEELKDAQVQIIEKERLEQELEIARRIQQSILPSSFPSSEALDFGARIEPMTAVGGDFFDVIQLGDDRFGLAIGDVTDHGVPAALFMASTATLLRVEAARFKSPKRVLESVNKHLLEMNEMGMFVTVVYGVFDCRSSTFTYTRAGHEMPIFLSPEGQLLPENKKPGQPLGVFTAPELREKQIRLHKGSLLVLYTDGIPDASDPSGCHYTLLKAKDFIQANGHRSAKEICDLLLEEIYLFREGHPPSDDVTILSVKVR